MPNNINIYQCIACICIVNVIIKRGKILDFIILALYERGAA